ncbi:MAG: hypothetical protein WCL00_02540, partial [Bacteroidota bacterium]
KQFVKMHELGLTFSSLNSFGLNYKTGSEKKLLRLSALFLNASTDWGKGKDPITGAGVDLRIGFERRIAIVKNLDLKVGSDFGIAFNYNREGGDYPTTVWQVSPVVAFVFGACYYIGDKFVLSAEVNPSLSYGYRHSINHMTNGGEVVTTSNSVYFGLNNIASLTLAYRFGK